MRLFTLPAVLMPAVLMIAAGPALAQPAAPFVVLESGKGFDRLADAVTAIGNGDGTIQIAAGRYSDCAVQSAGRVAYVARVSGTVTFDGGICEDKATLVLRGRSARVEGVRFTHEMVGDGNGAGIRLEQGDLTVLNTQFIDAQSGILSAEDPSGTIAIDHSTFSGLGKDPNGHGAHSLYVGKFGALKVTNSRFERGTGGHYLKCRAPRVEILDNSFDDSHGHDTNYMIDLSNGAVGRIAGNIFLDGLGKENHSVMIAVAAEGSLNSSAGLTIEHNRALLAPGFPWSTAFVGNWSHDPLTVRDNQLASGITASRSLAYRESLNQLRVALSSMKERFRAWLS
ncbi:MAG TPA: right-handed parallel beta-helix repeat-containing protein [Sphingomonas sp.]